MLAFSGVTSQCEERGFGRSAGTIEIAIAVVRAAMRCFSPLLKVSDRWSVNDPFSLRNWIPSTQMQ
jgi:hypothetical protein